MLQLLVISYQLSNHPPQPISPQQTIHTFQLFHSPPELQPELYAHRSPKWITLATTHNLEKSETRLKIHLYSWRHAFTRRSLTPPSKRGYVSRTIYLPQPTTTTPKNGDNLNHFTNNLFKLLRNKNNRSGAKISFHIIINGKKKKVDTTPQRKYYNLQNKIRFRDNQHTNLRLCQPVRCELNNWIG